MSYTYYKYKVLSSTKGVTVGIIPPDVLPFLLLGLCVVGGLVAGFTKGGVGFFTSAGILMVVIVMALTAFQLSVMAILLGSFCYGAPMLIGVFVTNKRR